jgi:hypothetical protein
MDKFELGQTVYVIVQYKQRFKIKCFRKHYENIKCNQCNNKLEYNKSFNWWFVHKHTNTIESIHQFKNGDIHYYVDANSFYEFNDGYLYPTHEDAQKECDVRNEKLYQEIIFPMQMKG